MSVSKVILFNELAELRPRFPREKIVQCHGVFDVLHTGHLAYFEAAKRRGSMLVVTITADEFVNKGPGRPYFTAQTRANMVAALSIVDIVSISPAPSAVESIRLLKPHFYVKGPDYKDPSQDITGGILEERAAVESGGGEVVFTEEDMFSSSTLLNRFFLEWTEDQASMIARAREAGGMQKIMEVLGQIAQYKVCVVGEPIIDTYRFVEPQNISSKSPTVSAKFINEENYAGGSLAIANHCADFVKSLDCLVTHGCEDYLTKVLSRMDTRVAMQEWPLLSTPTPRKTRYIAVDKSQRIFEVTEIKENQWRRHSPKAFTDDLLDLSFNADVTILADFGHGLFEDEVLLAIPKIRSFVGLNVQTNSSNYGYNVFHKHSRFDYLSLDKREAQVAYHDRLTPPLALGRRARKDLNAHGASVSMTLGENGSYFFPHAKGHDYFSPAFAASVVDATGAGDAFFALTTLLLKADCPPILIPFVGNVFAGLKTKIIGNKSAVTKAQLVKALSAILK